MIEGVQKGHFQLVYFTPEFLLQSKRWRRLLLSDLYQMKFKTVVLTALLHGKCLNVYHIQLISTLCIQGINV